MRVLCWFSCGAASAVATKLALQGHDPATVEILYTDPGSEHEDNHRFLKDCEEWFGHPVTILKNPDFKDTWAVWEKRRYLAGINGAPCTVELKKSLRQKYERPFEDIQVFGYTAEEVKRAERFKENNPEAQLSTPLIDRGLTKSDCFAMVDRAGIKLPYVYQFFDHANCIPCSKAKSVAYWQRVKKHFPDEFERYAKLADELGVKQIVVDGERKTLRELPAREYPWEQEPIECSLMCHIAESDAA